MTTGELLDLMEADAKEYRKTALASMARNASLYGFTASDLRFLAAYNQRSQRIVDAVLADFINVVAGRRGVNRGEKVEHLK